MKERQTVQKIKILEYLKSVKTHPSAETVFNAVREDIPTITLATVYRILNQMAKNGTILKLEINNEFRFDADLSNHQHCICRKCGIIYDMFEEKINKYAMRNFNLVNFIPSNVTVIFHGLCNNCEENKNE